MSEPTPKRLRGENGLTPKQTRFVTEYLATGNASEAYRRAYDTSGMKPATIGRRATDLLAHSTIKAQIANSGREAIEAATLTRQWIIERLMLNAQMALGQADIVSSVTKDGVTITETIRKIDHAAANRALELLGKIDAIGLFMDRKAVDIRQEFSGMSDDELDAYIKGRMH
jgi:phage terminase small subunit